MEYINLQTETWRVVTVSSNMYFYSLLFLFCLNIQNADSKRLEDRMSSLLGLFEQENLSACTAVLYGIHSRSLVDTTQVIMSGFSFNFFTYFSPSLRKGFKSKLYFTFSDLFSFLPLKSFQQFPVSETQREPNTKRAEASMEQMLLYCVRRTTSQPGPGYH